MIDGDQSSCKTICDIPIYQSRLVTGGIGWELCPSSEYVGLTPVKISEIKGRLGVPCGGHPPSRVRHWNRRMRLPTRTQICQDVLKFDSGSRMLLKLGVATRQNLGFDEKEEDGMVHQN